ncbi:ATP synthase subunit I [Halomonas sp. 18H]|uniref:ATP synthase subunit I n=1 Tax=Halomonas almeriensis TaxID=308163 RepID=UPI002231DD51|nr:MULTISPECIES: ATP synthase subunit I [Halomonas]MCW4152082.1 ATP synthase subunit I [Halomonas sp. 18H]MDN3552519.1 ATP synthase subunit I [Halomonas almeriensis]
MAARIKRPDVQRLMLAQLAVTGLMVLVAVVIDGKGGGTSALKGAVVALLPNLFFAWRAFRYRGGRQARKMVASLYRAEAGKFVLTVALFVVAFVAVPPSNHAFFFSAYVVMLFIPSLVGWMGRPPSPN